MKKALLPGIILTLMSAYSLKAQRSITPETLQNVIYAEADKAFNTENYNTPQATPENMNDEQWLKGFTINVNGEEVTVDRQVWNNRHYLSKNPLSRGKAVFADQDPSQATLDALAADGWETYNLNSEDFADSTSAANYVRDSVFMAKYEKDMDKGGFVGIADMPIKQQSKTYPNPFRQETTLSLDKKDGNLAKISVTSIKGKTVFQGMYDLNNSGKFTWNPNNNLPAGTYMIKATQDNKETTAKTFYVK